MYKHVFSVLAILLSLSFGCVAPQADFSLTDAQVSEDLAFLPQDLNVYAMNPADYAVFSQAILMTEAQRDRAVNMAREQLFAPWVKNNFTVAPQEAMWGLFSLKPENGFAENLRPYPAERWEALKKNCAVETFPNSDIRAITVRRCDVRLLPTSSPYFFNPSRPGQGYPFDFYQNSALPLGSPVRIRHISGDKQWGFIEHSSVMGWVNLENLAEVDEAFVLSWMGKHLAAVLDEKVLLEHDVRKPRQIGQSRQPGQPAEKSDRRFMGLPALIEEANIGTLLPYARQVGKKIGSEPVLTVYFPHRGYDGRARLLSCPVDAGRVAPWPIPLTRQNIARLGSGMMGQPYGWGGYGGNRDCSALMRDLFLPFGLWLPRNSAAQAQTGRATDLSVLTSQTKEQLILQQGIPFLSLIAMPGHIALYLGEYEGRAVIFHNLWGLRTVSGSPLFGAQKTGRVIVGKAVVTTVTPGAEKENIATPGSLLDRITSMNYLLDSEP
jgi:hypothetical protein